MIDIDIVLQDFWSPIIFVLVLLLTTLVAYLIYSMGNSDYNKTGEKGTPFISGNRPPSDLSKIHVAGDNVFWGFMEALKGYFDPVVKGHTGKVNDYIYWIVITLAVVLVFIMI